VYFTPSVPPSSQIVVVVLVNVSVFVRRRLSLPEIIDTVEFITSLTSRADQSIS